MNDLKGKTAIVTGASSGIGRAVAVALAAAGASVMVAARNEQGLSETASLITQAGGTASVCVTDVTDEAQVQQLFGSTVAAFGGVDLVVNNAGVTTSQPIEDLTLAAWRQVLDVNLTGAFLCSREAFRVMKPRGGGRIINMGSVAALVPRPNSVPYTTTKHGLDGMTHALALDGREHGIAVSVLHPGVTESALAEKSGRKFAPGELMKASDVARVVLLMASLPPEVNLYESVIFPLSMPLLGRG
ncbi:oxidoreductase [Pigmentiphaga litoralis]|jgi:NAD(P)-dependent dehydrogenase (short-subunit alcohol dehydrogenase family)|uniref:SDR family oxidoreductase n=1 Tax=Pigmentiphaga litoralis TaxID=516702 RepID=UPI001677EFD3|nr:SDR family oxidoreductase [Pigmentiphaga litoralis]GGX07130.1 oxidoreductase [Pigmentiphaga litoralis]